MLCFLLSHSLVMQSKLSVSGHTSSGVGHGGEEEHLSTHTLPFALCYFGSCRKLPMYFNTAAETCERHKEGLDQLFQKHHFNLISSIILAIAPQ